MTRSLKRLRHPDSVGTPAVGTPVATPDPMPGARSARYWEIDFDHARVVAGGVIEEARLTIFVNGQEIAALMCSPIDQHALALGFLLNEGVIDSLEEVRLVKLNVARTAIDVFLTRPDVTLPRRMVLTSGCGGGVSFSTLSAQFEPLASDFVMTPALLLERMRDLQHAAQLYRQVRGVHTAILAAPDRVLASAEDIGRHNTIDRLTGQAAQQHLDTADMLLLTSGRISSEMITKARRMRVPLVASRTAPTSLTLHLADAWNLCVVGYARQGHLRVYTHPERLGLPPIPGATE